MIFASPRSSVSIPEVSLPQFALRHAQRLKEKIAFIDGGTGRSISYSDASEMIESLAASFADIGFTKGDVLAIFAANRPEYPIVAHAAMLAGGSVTTVNPMYSVAEVQNQLCATGAKFLVTTASLIEKAIAAVSESRVKHILSIDEADGAISVDQLLSKRCKLTVPPCNPRDDVAALPFSSGTTGLPKGVMLTHYNLVANTTQFLSLGVTREHDVVLSVPPMCHIYGWTVMINVIMSAGATAITMPQFGFEPFLRLLQDYKVTQTFVAPSIVQLLATHPLVENYDLSNLKTVISAGAPLSGELSDACANRLNCVVIQGYGMTEAGPITHFGCANAELNRNGTIGHLYPDTLCRIVDIVSKDDLGVDCDGEIWVKGPQLMKGYLNNPEETQKLIDKDGWLHTGDVGKVDRDGYLSVSDRIKELIKYKGFQVPPAELEGILLQHPAVAEAAVIPSPNEASGEIPLALVVRKGSVSESELMEFVAERVTTYKRVREVEFVDEIPKTSSGKILRRVLVEQHREKVAQRSAQVGRILTGRITPILIAIVLSTFGIETSAYGHAEAIPASGTPSQSFSEYSDAQSGLIVKYPRGWTLQLHPDKDVLFKFSGTKDEASGEMAVSANTDPAASAEKLLKMYQLMMFSQLQNFKSIAEKKIAFGVDRKFEGLSQDVAFDMGGLPVRQRYVLFDHNGKAVTIKFTSAAPQFDKLLPTYDDMLLSVRPTTGASTQDRAATGGGASTLVRLQSSSSPVRFAYPSGWSVTEKREDPDNPLAISGTDAAGHPGSIGLFSGDLHPNASLEQAVQALEERHFSRRAEFKTTRQETVNFGSSSRLSGIVHESTFNQGGFPAAQKAVFFREGNRLYVIALTGVAWKESEMNILFQKLLATVESE